VRPWDTFAEPGDPVANSSTEGGGPGRPRLSVIVAASNDGALLARCVDALAAQAHSDAVEVLIARDAGRFDDVDRIALDRRIAGLRWIEAPPGTTVPRLRGLGIAQARADLIAMIEDDCVVADGWCRAAIATAGEPAAVGGAVEPGSYRRPLDWAVYFCEYGRFMLPLPSGPGAPLTGNNVVYSRLALMGLPDAVRTDFREAFVHATWQKAGIPTRVSESLVVRNINRWSLRHVTTVPFHHGRAYAAERFGARQAPVRVALAVLALGLPLLKLVRIAAGTLKRRRLTGRLLVAFPWAMIFVGSWSFGEILGCLAGPGDSPSRWR
jgi:hypothetical protein